VTWQVVHERKNTVFWNIHFRGDSRSNTSLGLVTPFIPRPLLECNRSRLASMKFPFAFILASTIVAMWRKLRNNELDVLMRTRRLFRNVCSRATIMPVSSLHTRLIHISPSYWAIILFVSNNSRIGFVCATSLLLKNIQSDMNHN